MLQKLVAAISFLAYNGGGPPKDTITSQVSTGWAAVAVAIGVGVPVLFWLIRKYKK